MSVKAILDEKGRRVVTVAPQETLRSAAALLNEHRIGAVVVLEGETITGVLAERDVVGAVARHGASALDMPVAQLMSREVHLCSEATSIHQLMETMNRHRARHLPVERNGRLIGIVSIGDAVRNHIRTIEGETEQIKAYIAG
ncbi:inosine-5-monophosphate dehydrogenase [Rhizobium rhizosphaerae]|uniref:Inosine-5-monophosphate dehydrogenase n=1 Tax=Xaviernesmea rhizosphaerae TaxID=1672749 RepID=A0A1Q9AJA1_9HYPH|nr:CBS domain-containing protein [Xaviernesmea rhizosphaerae]OLP55352.1 inosine-5-monophosphate dehydrogenase [Xaviernesmea rhizosphaerae]OQP87949.1 inosine-5-monophosphate dehydrogenase [Xaviernesmea rhizosphaerae]